MSAEIVKFPNTNLQDIPAHMHKLADYIANENKVESAIVVVRTKDGQGRIHLFGSVDGLNQPIIQLECAKAQLVDNLRRT